MFLTIHAPHSHISPDAVGAAPAEPQLNSPEGAGAAIDAVLLEDCILAVFEVDLTVVYRFSISSHFAFKDSFSSLPKTPISSIASCHSEDTYCEGTLGVVHSKTSMLLVSNDMSEGFEIEKGKIQLKFLSCGEIVGFVEATTACLVVVKMFATG